MTATTTGFDTPPAAPSCNGEFLRALAGPLASVNHSLAWVCAFPGVPSNDHPGWTTGHAVNFDGANTLDRSHNAYFSVSLFPPGTARRRKKSHPLPFVVCVDDAQRVPLAPSYVLRTSEHKVQVGFALADAVDEARYTRLMRHLSDARYIIGDPSGNNSIRLVRLPFGANGKTPEPFPHVLEQWHPERRYPFAQVCAALGFDPSNVRTLRAIETPAADSDGRKLRDHVRAIIAGEDGRVHDALYRTIYHHLKRGMEPAGVIETLHALFDAATWRERNAPVWQQRRDSVQSEVFRTHANIGQAAANDASAAPQPVNILRPLAAPPLRVEDVPKVLGDFVNVHARATGFDPSIMLMGGIVSAAAMLSDGVRLCVNSRAGWFESARLWACIVGSPGAGKTPGLKLPMRPVYDVHRELCQADAANAAGAEDNSNADRPPRRALFTSDATVEALSEILKDNPRGILYSVDEFESWLCAQDAYRNNGAGKDRGEWLRLYDGGPHQINRITRGAFFVPNWGASLLCATTPSVMRKLAPRLPEDGLLQRLLLVLVRTRELPDDSMLPVVTRQATEAWDATLRRLHAQPDGVVQLSADAADVLRATDKALHALTLACEDGHPPFAAHMAKRCAMVARLALTFHGLNADNIAAPIPGETMAQAARFMRRQERHALAAYRELFGKDTGMELARMLAAAILASGSATLNRRSIAAICNPFRTADESARLAALSLLCDFGWLTQDTPHVHHGTTWTVDARVHELFADEGRRARERRALIRARINGQAGD